MGKILATYLVKRKDWDKFVKKFNSEYAWEMPSHLSEYNPFINGTYAHDENEIYVNVETYYCFEYGRPNSVFEKYHGYKGVWIRKTKQNNMVLSEVKPTNWLQSKESIE